MLRLPRLSRVAVSQLAHDMISAIIFDLDGTLIDTERPTQRAWQTAMSEFGLSMPDSMYALSIGRTAPDTFRIWREMVDDDVPFEQIRLRAVALVDEERTRQGIRVFPGVVESLTFVTTARLACALATSTFRAGAEKKLHHAGLRDFFSVVVCGDDVSASKPAPDIYLETARRLGLAPALCVAVEDSENGVRSAHSAGMPVVLVPDLVAPSPEVRAMADVVLSSLGELPGWLQGGDRRPSRDQ